MAPIAGPFSCSLEAFPARLEDKRLFGLSKPKND
jgi:hypothetical protein